MTQDRDGTGAGLEEFLDWAGSKGELNPTTAKALRTTSMKVLEVYGDPSAVNVTDLDVDEALGRWENLNRTNYSNGSLLTYKSRFRQAVAMYRAWLIKDSDWKAAGKGSSSTGVKAATKRGRPRKATNASESDGDAVAAAAEGVRLVSYELPLRPELLVRLTLPVDLTKQDAQRISAFVSSLAFADIGDGNQQQEGA